MDTLPLALGIMHSRPYYRCRHCNLVQFLQRSQLCRRCGRTLRMFEEPPTTRHWMKKKLASAFGVPLSYLFRPVNGNFYREIHSEIFRALQPEQLKYVAQACALLAKNKREGRDAIELFLGRRGKPSGPRPRKRRSSS